MKYFSIDFRLKVQTDQMLKKAAQPGGADVWTHVRERHHYVVCSSELRLFCFIGDFLKEEEVTGAAPD